MATRAEAWQGECVGHGFGINVNPKGFHLGQDFWRRARVALLPPGFFNHAWLIATQGWPQELKLGKVSALAMVSA